MTEVVLLYTPDKSSAALRLRDAVAAQGYGVEAVEMTPDRSPAGAAGAKALVVLWSRAAMASGPILEAADAARRGGRLIEVSADGIMPVAGPGEEDAVLISGWRGEPFHPGWKRVESELQRLCGAPRPATAPAPPRVAAAAPIPAALVKSAPAAAPAAPAAAPAAPAATRAERPKPKSRWIVPALGGAALLFAAAGGAALMTRNSPPPPPEAPVAVTADPVPTPAPAPVQPEIAPEEAPAAVVDPPSAPAAAPRPELENAARSIRAAAAERSKPAAQRAVPPPQGRYSRKNSRTMRLFCERSGRSTPECRAFRRAQMSAGDGGGAGRSLRKTAREPVRYRNARNMRLFCERAGRGTKECRIFRRRTDAD